MPRGPMKFELLRDQLATSGGSIAEVRAIATNLGVMEDRYLARPAAEILIQRGAPGSERMAATLQTMPITGKDYKGDMLRAAFRTALDREGISPQVENVARAFYERRQKASLDDDGGMAPPPAAEPYGHQPPPPAEGTGDPIQDIGNAIKKLFG
jgi:hypothetical protein